MDRIDQEINVSPLIDVVFISLIVLQFLYMFNLCYWHLKNWEYEEHKKSNYMLEPGIESLVSCLFHILLGILIA